MASLPSSRRTGILSAWYHSKNRGTVLDPKTNEFFFICKYFIVAGEPIVGSAVTFTPRPAKEGTSFPQAGFAVIDSGKAGA